MVLEMKTKVMKYFEHRIIGKSFNQNNLGNFIWNLKVQCFNTDVECYFTEFDADYKYLISLLRINNKLRK